MILILMATYKGEKYIMEQLDSLFAQTEQDFILTIRDDRSTDGTYEILERYKKRYPEKISLSRTEVNTGGAKYNFIDMMTEHKADYVMLCDQDDVWLPNKIELTLAKMKEEEVLSGASTPLLVHTDLRVVNEKLETVSPSFKTAMNADYNKTELRSQIIQNTVTGCTAMYNRALAVLIAKCPPDMVMHDWWLSLVASAFGKISHIDVQTILYRQHGKNNIGAKNVRRLGYKLDRLFHRNEVRASIAQTYLQAESLLNIYRDRLSSEQISLLENYRCIPKLSKLQRIRMVFKLGAFKNGFSRNIAYLLFI